MTEKTERDRAIGKIIAYLKKENAQQWSIQDKGVLVAAIKQALSPKKEQR